MTCMTHTEGPCQPALTEELVLNPNALPGSMKGWRYYRIEYGFECSCPEGHIWLPARVDPQMIEELLCEGGR